jgi:preprotein translocase subunit SecB
MQLQLIATKATEVNLKTQETEGAEKRFDLQHSFFVDERETNVFGISFNIQLQNPFYHLSIQYVGLFQTSEPIDEVFKNSDFPIVNAPAIAYPYLRAFIANLTLNAGYEPVNLPSINFAVLKQNSGSSGNETKG